MIVRSVSRSRSPVSGSCVVIAQRASGLVIAQDRPSPMRDVARRSRCPPRAARRRRARSASGSDGRRPRRRRGARASMRSEPSVMRLVGLPSASRPADRSGRCARHGRGTRPAPRPTGRRRRCPTPVRPWIGVSMASPRRDLVVDDRPSGNVRRRTVASGSVQRCDLDHRRRRSAGRPAGSSSSIRKNRRSSHDALAR